jgi:hypothetical protein
MYFMVTRDSSSNPVDIEIWHPQLEDVTGQANQNPSEYVSTNVKTSAPYHGANVDGVKYFTTYNGNTVASNVVTEATGASIPDATLHGYVAEGARTNLALYSNQLNAWVGGSSVTADTATSPDGSLTADTLTANGSPDSGLRLGSTGQAINTSHTLSVYAKYNSSGRWLYLRNIAIETSDKNAIAWFDLQNGVVGTKRGDVTNSTITAIGNGWYRLTLTGVTTATIANNTIDIKTSNADNVLTTTNGQSLYLWGAQLEAGSFASSYIPTTTASVTRNADVETYPTTGNFLDAQGSAYAEVISSSWANATAQIIGDGTESPLKLSSANSGVQAFDGTNTANGPAGTPTGKVKIAVSWSGATMKVFANGVAGASATYDGTFSLSSLGIGAGTVGGGTIRNVRIWKKQLTDAQLVALTT